MYLAYHSETVSFPLPPTMPLLLSALLQEESPKRNKFNDAEHARLYKTVTQTSNNSETDGQRS